MLAHGLDFHQVADHLGRSYSSVTSWAAAHNVLRNSFQRWTARDVSRAREMYGAGYSCAQIGEALGRKEHSVYHQLRKLRITRRDRSGWHRVEVEALRYSIALEGWTANEAAFILRLGCTPRTYMAWVHDYAKRAGLPKVKFPRGPRAFRQEAAARRAELDRVRGD